MGKLGIFHGTFSFYVIFYKGGNFSRPTKFKWTVSKDPVWSSKVAPKELIEWLD
jgi:hypothetical protein